MTTQLEMIKAAYARYDSDPRVHGPSDHFASFDAITIEIFQKLSDDPPTSMQPPEQKPKYLDWANAGGPNECKHGYAKGIPCPQCDLAHDAEAYYNK